MLAGLVVILMLSNCQFALAQHNQLALTVTEVMYDPAGEDTVISYGQTRTRQWIEVFNPSSSAIEIVGGIGEEVWTFIDSTGTHFFAKTPARGSLIIAPGEYIVLAGDAYVFLQEYPWYKGTIIDVRMELQHQYDFIQIKNNHGEVMAQALWSYNIGGQGNGKTLEFYSKDDVRESILVGGTPGQPNNQQQPTPTSGQPTPSPVIPKETITTEPYPRPLSFGKIIINELFPGGSIETGWIELRSLEPYAVNMNGWKIKTTKSSLVFASSTIIEPYGFIMVSSVSPSQTGDIITLINPANTPMFEVEYQSPIPQSWSVSRFPSGWAITTELTPLKDNILALPQALPQNPVIIETHPTTYPTSTLLSLLIAPEKPFLYALITAISGAIIFIIIKRKFTW